MLLYLFAVRCLCTSMAHFFHSRHVAAGLSGLLGFLLALPAGPALLHPDAMGQYITWLRFVSPAAYTAILTSEGEFTPVNNFRCTANPVITDNSIIKQVRHNSTAVSKLRARTVEEKYALVKSSQS